MQRLREQALKIGAGERGWCRMNFTKPLLQFSVAALIVLHGFLSEASDPHADLALNDAAALAQGRYVNGAILGTVIGYGTGHAVQKRYRDIGWIFTAGDATFTALSVVTAGICVANQIQHHDCHQQEAISYVASGSLIAFRTWEIVDLWATPAAKRRKFEQIYLKKLRASDPQALISLQMSPKMSTQIRSFAENSFETLSKSSATLSIGPLLNARGIVGIESMLSF